MVPSKTLYRSRAVKSTWARGHNLGAGPIEILSFNDQYCMSIYIFIDGNVYGNITIKISVS